MSLDYLKSKEFWKAALVRAWHTVWETACSTLPASFVVTPAMIEQFGIKQVYVVLAWMATALFAGVLSLIKSVGKGIPEVDASKE